MSSRAEQVWGSNDVDSLFGGNPSTAAPWPRAGRRKDLQDYQPELVQRAIKDRQGTEPVDPRKLYATQPGLTRAGVQHYLSSDKPFADAHQAGNERPVVYDRNGTQMLLSGHHRAAKSLLRGEQFDAVVVRGDWGDPR